MPPNDFNDWYTLVNAFVKGLVQRYGLETIRGWYFEVWNGEWHFFIFSEEGGVDARATVKSYNKRHVPFLIILRAELWGMPFPSDYIPLYNASARAIKDVDPQIPVGGPATMQVR